ncbi:hypothetical protein DFR29_102499 [Tahibacter aquaticus]|uniref:Uncharacterized protein n=2 Tax=Tahibacter aquaticus TaxID=520092 RepID=A0A4R6Z7Q5_9GAMM|nr:hypothetical protein DFR29_102499 [Tahibacter aquaticus]
MLLLSEGRDDEARRCAESWIQNLSRRRDPELQPLIGFLREIQRNGAAILERIAANPTNLWLTN